MPNLTLKSERQIQTSMLAVLIAQLGLNDINPGSVIDILTQAAAQSDFALYYQIAQVSRLADLEAMTGSDLDLKAFEYGLFRRLAVKATGTISVLRPAGFVKVATTFYAGFPAPIIGDTTINVNDASNALIGTSGTLVLGRGTNNEEEVSYTSAPINNTNYFTFTLTTPCTKNHATEESVILKQGLDQSIQAGTTVVVPATGTSEEIQFATVNDEVVMAGEDRVADVEVIAVSAGSSGNVSSMAINGTAAFPSPPFSGARAQNDSKYTTGRDLETDDELRDRIKDAVPALSRGIKQAIKNAIVGIVDPVSAKRVVSASIVLPVADAEAVKVYIDDGTGFEPTFDSIGFETIKASSSGGEQRLQLNQFPVVKAQIENNVAEPYNFSAGSKTLSFEVGSTSETITFNTSDFRFPDIAAADEVAAAINDRSILVEARTSQGGKKVVITAKVDVNENLQVTGGTANSILGFPTDRKDTLNLYVDDVKLSKDGETATLDSRNSAPFNLLAIGAYPHSITVVVDGKTANPQTATINTGDVADPSAVTVAEICAVLNRDLAGLTAVPSFANTKVRIESNTKLSSSSKLHVVGGTMNNIATQTLSYRSESILGTFKLEFGTTKTVALGPDGAGDNDAAVQAALRSISGLENVVCGGGNGYDTPITISFNGVEGVIQPLLVTDVTVEDVIGPFTPTIAVTQVDNPNGLDFSPTEKVGINGDYVFNRELGIVQLTKALSANQTVTSGSLFTRAKLRASVPELYSPSNGQTLLISVDGGADQTITFDASFVAGKTAQQTALFINSQLRGATAIVRTIGSLNYLEIRTNTFDVSGSIRIQSSSTANPAFNFTLASTAVSDSPNKAFRVSSSVGPYAFSQGDSLVVVLDNDIVNNTFSINFNVNRTATAAASTTVFSDSGLNSIFPTADQIKDFFVAFTAGANTTSETVTTVTVLGGNLARYTFDAPPANFAAIAVGDLVKFTGLDSSENNRAGIIAAKGASSVDIFNPTAVNASTQTGTGVLSQKRTVTAYNQLSGQITVGVAFSNTPTIGDPFLVIPATVQNVVDYVNNTKISSISLKAAVEGVSNNTKVQIASSKEGSDGYVQITGGSANDVLGFTTDLYRGLAGYQYWTGLIDLVHKVVYGDDTDLVSYPGIGAAGVIFRLLAPTVKDIQVQLDVTLREGVSIASLENEIRSAVTGYVNNLGVGDDVVIEEIRSAVIQISGVIDVSISVPSTNVAIADNELARVADSAILIG